jgi:activator of 2-hydroxyglutaryl-CoA dehydratase
VISLKNLDTPPQDIARGGHISVVNRISAMLGRLGCGESLVISGGVARNPCIVQMLSQRLDNVRVESPAAPDIVGALGAAIYAGR